MYDLYQTVLLLSLVSMSSGVGTNLEWGTGEARRAESGGGFLGERGSQPSSPARRSAVSSIAGSGAEPRPPKGFLHTLCAARLPLSPCVLTYWCILTCDWGGGANTWLAPSPWAGGTCPLSPPPVPTPMSMPMHARRYIVGRSVRLSVPVRHVSCDWLQANTFLT